MQDEARTCFTDGTSPERMAHGRGYRDVAAYGGILRLIHISSGMTDVYPQKGTEFLPITLLRWKQVFFHG